MRCWPRRTFLSRQPKRSMASASSSGGAEHLDTRLECRRGEQRGSGRPARSVRERRAGTPARTRSSLSFNGGSGAERHVAACSPGQPRGRGRVLRRRDRAGARAAAATTSASAGSASGQSSTSPRGYGSSASHSSTLTAAEAGGDDLEPSVAERHHADDAGDRADRRAHVAATDLAAPFDEHDAELRRRRRRGSRGRAGGTAARTR